jgi:hypothetical protein
MRNSAAGTSRKPTAIKIKFREEVERAVRDAGWGAMYELL